MVDAAEDHGTMMAGIDESQIITETGETKDLHETYSMTDPATGMGGLGNLFEDDGHHLCVGVLQTLLMGDHEIFETDR